MNSHHRWLLEQLPQWERDGLLTADAARTLRERHTAQQAAEDSHPGLAQIAMGALGALLIGSGVLAVIGYNWDDFSRPVRLLFAFLPLLAAQTSACACYSVVTRSPAGWVRETAGLLQVLATGACIAIVSQIYNLGGEWPEFLFWWMLLSLPLAWVLRSKAVALFYLVAIATWSLDRAEHGRPWYDSPLIYPLLLLGLLPLWPGWPAKNTPSPFMRWMITISAIFGLCSATSATGGRGYYLHFDIETVVWLWTLIAAALALFPLNRAGMAESLGRKPQVVLGSLWLLGYGCAGTFHDVSDDILEGMSQGLKQPWAWAVLTVIAVFVVLAVLRQRWAVLSIATIGLLPLLGYPFATMLNWVFTLYLFGLGITLIVLEFIGHRGAPRLGAALLSALIIARMADSHFSLLVKGIIFIAVGVAFLVFNIAMSRLHRQKKLTTS